MFGYVAERQQRSGWVILPLLFILAFAWWIAVVAQRAGESGNILRLGLAVAVGLSLPNLGYTYMMKRRRRHKDEAKSAEGEGGPDTEADGQPTAEESSEDRPLTYGEIFNPDQPDLDDGGLPPWVEGEGWHAEGNESEGEGTEGQSPAEEPSEEHAPTSEEGVFADQTDLGETVDLEAIQADLEAQESLRRLREEFKARAMEAELRVKQRQAELDQAESNPTTP
jgi:hypothetical protein